VSLAEDKKKLAHIVSSLSESQRATLLEFAEFLLSRTPVPASRPDQDKTLQKPEPIPRPEQETVINAIKRLSKTYTMLDKAKLLNHTSSLMSQHIMQGRAAAEVIDELEKVFAEYYQAYVETIQE